MNLGLRPLRGDEFTAWVEHLEAWYAGDLEINGGLTRGEALRKAEADTTRAFPQGLGSPDNHVFVVEADGQPVGSVWFSPREVEGETVAFLYALEIDEALRGQGLGREAMTLFEAEARSRGFRRVVLNVFGGNERARRLYRSLGYAERAVHMGKEL